MIFNEFSTTILEKIPYRNRKRLQMRNKNFTAWSILTHETNRAVAVTPSPTPPLIQLRDVRSKVERRSCAKYMKDIVSVRGNPRDRLYSAHSLV